MHGDQGADVGPNLLLVQRPPKVYKMVRVPVEPGGPYHIVYKIVRVLVGPGGPYHIIYKIVRVLVEPGGPYHIVYKIVRVPVEPGGPYHIERADGFGQPQSAGRPSSQWVQGSLFQLQWQSFQRSNTTNDMRIPLSRSFQLFIRQSSSSSSSSSSSGSADC